jgi:hypothetical protein
MAGELAAKGTGRTTLRAISEAGAKDRPNASQVNARGDQGGLRKWRKMRNRAIELQLTLPDLVILTGILGKYTDNLGKLETGISAGVKSWPWM